MTDRSRHLQCPFCTSYDVQRLFLASMGLDCCVCGACTAQWDEDADTGEYRGRSSRESVVAPRHA